VMVHMHRSSQQSASSTSPDVYGAQPTPSHALMSLYPVLSHSCAATPSRVLKGRSGLERRLDGLGMRRDISSTACFVKTVDLCDGEGA
jgi:hypothetical protein